MSDETDQPESKPASEPALEQPVRFGLLKSLIVITAAAVFMALAFEAHFLVAGIYFFLVSVGLFIWLRSIWPLIPLIVVLGLVLLSTFVIRVREAARRNTCASNIRQLALAVENYESGNKKYPSQNILAGRTYGNITVNHVPGATSGGMGIEASNSLIVMLIPQFDEGDPYYGPDLDKNPFDDSKPTDSEDRSNAQYACYPIPVLQCPNFTGKIETISQDYGTYTHWDWEGARKPMLTQYVGMGATTYENLYRLEGKSPDGMIVSNIILTKEDVTDGLSNTIILCETREEKYAVWMDGTTASVFGITSDGKTTINKGGAAPYIPAANFGGSEDWQWGPSSMHEGMAHHAFGDDSVRAIADDIAPDVYKALITRSGNDGEATKSFFGE